MGLCSKIQWKAITAMLFLVLLISLNFDNSLLRQNTGWWCNPWRQTQFLLGPDSHCHIWVCSMQRTAFLIFVPSLFESVSQKCLLWSMQWHVYPSSGLSFAFYDDNRIGELMSRMTGGSGRHTHVCCRRPVDIAENAIFYSVQPLCCFLLTQNWLCITLAHALYCMGGC